MFCISVYQVSFIGLVSTCLVTPEVIVFRNACIWTAVVVGTYVYGVRDRAKKNIVCKVSR